MATARKNKKSGVVDFREEGRKNFECSNEELIRTCRNCHDEEGDDFIAPCNCSGSLRWVHRRCLDEWRTVSKRTTSFTRCDICNFEYKLSDQFEEKKTWLKTKVGLLILRDFCLMALAFQVLVCACIGLVMARDSDGSRASYFSSEWSTIRVNYTAGLLCFFFLFGIASTVYGILKVCGVFRAEADADAEYTHDTYPYYRSTSFYWSTPTRAVSPNGGISASSSCDTTLSSTSSCNATHLGSIGGGKGGDKELPLLVIVFIVIGVLVGVGMATYFMIVRATHHIETTYKRVKATSIVVVDLALQ